MSNNYVHAFKQSTLYRQYLQRSPIGHRPNRNEEEAQWSSDPTRLTIVVENYTSRSSFFYCAPHLKGEEVFGFAKRFADYPLGTNNDSHCRDHVNFFHP
jgi:hypothetical protein